MSPQAAMSDNHTATFDSSDPENTREFSTEPWQGDMEGGTGAWTIESEVDREFREEALPELDAVYSFALRLTQEEAEAEDLVQETFLRAYRNWHQYTPGTKCKSWLFTICRNLFTRSQQRQSRHREILLEQTPKRRAHQDAGSVGVVPSPTTNPEEEFFDGRIDRVLLDRIRALPAEYREVVILSDIEGLSYKDMAQVLEVPIGTIRSRLSRGRSILRDELWDYAVGQGIVRPAWDSAQGPDSESPLV